MDIDDIIVNTLNESTETILQSFTIKAPGKNQINTAPRSIIVGIDKDEPETAGNDFDENREIYAMLITIQQVDYKTAKKLLRDVKAAIMRTLHKDLDDIYSEYMKYEGTDYGYDEESNIRTADVRVSCLVEDNYSDDTDEFTDIKLRGDLID
jgi:uncharacterized protein YheU (UPF0270 family)